MGQHIARFMRKFDVDSFVLWCRFYHMWVNRAFAENTSCSLFTVHGCVARCVSRQLSVPGEFGAPMDLG